METFHDSPSHPQVLVLPTLSSVLMGGVGWEWSLVSGWALTSHLFWALWLNMSFYINCHPLRKRVFAHSRLTTELVVYGYKHKYLKVVWQCVHFIWGNKSNVFLPWALSLPSHRLLTMIIGLGIHFSWSEPQIQSQSGLFCPKCTHATTVPVGICLLGQVL